jgi:hypothetical protein
MAADFTSTEGCGNGCAAVRAGRGAPRKTPE